MSVVSMRPPLWTGNEAAAASDAQAIGGTAWNAAGVSIDSRTLQPGDLFVALKGETADGHGYVRAAFEKGAAAALVARTDLDAAGGPLLVVDDTLAALVGLGRVARARCRARIVAVTGSVGKTSTKEALRHVLAAQGKTHAATASHNNHIGVPLTLARLPADAAFAVCEIGTNHPGEIEPLARQVRAHVGVITAIAGVHLENFASVEAIAEEKAKIFVAMDDGGAVLPRDSTYYDRLVTGARAAGVVRHTDFGQHADAQFRLLDCDLNDTGSAVRALAKGREVRYRLGAPGRHWVLNSLAVLAAVDALGGELDA
ncbi:MAG TPA: Mur ligase family protein, partial [Vineibacter sp.]|nr:Mur ligase family protein [Vineibacter sp.]